MLLLKHLVSAITPHLNKIGESLISTHQEHGLPPDCDVRIVIAARPGPGGKVQTFMQFVRSDDDRTPEHPDRRTVDTLYSPDGKPLLFGIEGLVDLISRTS